MPPTDGGHALETARDAAASGSARPRSGPTRATPLVLLVLAGVLLAARVGLGVYEEGRPVERADRVEWRTPAAGEAEAREGGRLMLYLFTRDGDPLTRQMSREVFGDPRAAAAIEERFVPIRVLDLSREGTNPPEVAGLQRQYDVRGFPTLVVAFPGLARHEKQIGYPGAMATTRFFSRAAARLLLRTPGERPVSPDSTFT